MVAVQGVILDAINYGVNDKWVIISCSKIKEVKTNSRIVMSDSIMKIKTVRSGEPLVLQTLIFFVYYSYTVLLSTKLQRVLLVYGFLFYLSYMPHPYLKL